MPKIGLVIFMDDPGDDLNNLDGMNAIFLSIIIL